MQAEADSRDYIVAYRMKSRADAPRDFEELPDFHAGLFLPQARPDWFGHRAFPPRVVALVEDGLLVVPHPSARAPCETFLFDKFAFVESGRMLLKGWIRLVGDGLDRTFFFNTRSAIAVDGFFRVFKMRFLPSGDARPSFVAVPRLHLKFQNLLADEVEAGESLQACFFQPAQRFTYRVCGVRRSRTVPNDLLVRTTRRLLWITDRDGRGYAPYGSITRYAPLAGIGAISVTEDDGQRVLLASIRSSEWRIPLSHEQREEAMLFCAAHESAAQFLQP